MNGIVRPYRRAAAAPVSWFQFATRHRASIASLAVLIFPLVMPFTALAVNILIYGLYALGFNLVYGYLGLLSFGHAALFGTGAYFCGIAIGCPGIGDARLSALFCRKLTVTFWPAWTWT